MELPIEFENRMKDMLKEEYSEFFEEFTKNESISGVRINKLKEAPEKLLNILSDLKKIPWCDNGYYIKKEILDGNSPFHIGGLLYFQEPSAMSVVSAIGIKPGDYVLDLCSAPGGKATQIAEELAGEGVLVANEIVKKRSLILSDNIERMGIKNAIVTNETPERLSEKFPQFFNKIIVDAPCSGEGMFRKEPKALVEWSKEHTESCALRQKLIIDSAIKMLSPGGELIYSTCTFAPCENEGVVQYILDNYPDMELIPIKLPYFTDADARFVNSSYDMSYAKRIFPHKNKGEGHFIALFKKSGEFKKPVFKENKAKLSEEKMFLDFQEKFLNTDFSGTFVSFGENLYLMPENIDIDKLKVERAGLHLGRCKKGRFEPSHALLMSLTPSEIKNTFEAEDISGFLRGETLKGDICGWCSVTYLGINIGWAKGTDGILKNHFPKHLRLF